MTVPLAVAVYDLLTFSQLPVSNKVTLVSAMGMTAFLFSMVRGRVCVGGGGGERREAVLVKRSLLPDSHLLTRLLWAKTQPRCSHSL